MNRMCMFILAFWLCCSCTERRQYDTTPWGEAVEENDFHSSRELYQDKILSFSDIQNNGEMIMLTLSGPDTYYEYHGRGMGLQYLLCEKFAKQIGVSLRVELCRDTLEMIERLSEGDGDLIAYPLPLSVNGVIHCGPAIDSLKTQWAVNVANESLADTLDRWFQPQMLSEIRQEEALGLSSQGIFRRVYAPMLNSKGGVISHYDEYFRRYAPVARWDWRLLAAQCYQESTFDPNARSWAGACGLMQIMPATATHLGLSHERLFDPEQNIAAAAKYISELNETFRDVPGTHERISFVLAAYNGGALHVRDAMALARKHGKNQYKWANVAPFVLRLREPRYYNDPAVRHGYMRGDETVAYVSRIRQRWSQYQGVAKGSVTSNGVVPPPRKAKRPHRFSQ